MTFSSGKAKTAKTSGGGGDFPPDVMPAECLHNIARRGKGRRTGKESHSSAFPSFVVVGVLLFSSSSSY